MKLRQFYWLLGFLCASLFSITIQASHSGKAQTCDSVLEGVLCISSYQDKTFPKVLADIQQQYQGSEVLFVFDIDNTLLTMPDPLGSHEWHEWKKGLPADNEYKVECLLDVQGMFLQFAHLVPTEPVVPILIKQLQDLRYTVIALTARGWQYRYPTERELNLNGIDFSKSALRNQEGKVGYPGKYMPNMNGSDKKPRPVSYQDGVLMVAGQDKGLSLLDLLERSGKVAQYKFIVFVDDSHRNVENMLWVLQATNKAFRIFEYKAIKDRYSRDELRKLAPELKKVLSFFNENLERRQGCDI
jgi:Protein of unknown function (DUF2608)